MAGLKDSGFPFDHRAAHQRPSEDRFGVPSGTPRDLGIGLCNGIPLSGVVIVRQAVTIPVVVVNTSGRASARRTVEARHNADVEPMPAITFVEMLDTGGASVGMMCYIGPRAEALLDYATDDWPSMMDLCVRLVHSTVHNRAAERVRNEATDEPYRMECGPRPVRVAGSRSGTRCRLGGTKTAFPASGWAS